MKKLALFTLVLFAIQACDVIDEPLKDPYGFIQVPLTNKVVLIEEFTGVQCTFCPAGARKISGYLKAYPENVVAVAMHVSGFSTPYPGDPSLKVDEAQTFYENLGSAGLPQALIDREGYPVDVFKNPADWNTVLVDELIKPSEFTITSDFSYNSSDSTFELDVDVLSLSELSTAPIYLTAYLLEDSIVTKQLDNGQTINGYVQNHVFRSSFAGMNGQEISNGTALAGQTYTRKYKLKADPVWRTDKCSAVVFVYNSVTQEVLQAHSAGDH